jgi:hypothetical protein
MRLRGGWITIKHHRLDLGGGAVALVGLGLAALFVNSQLAGVHLPAGCLSQYLANSAGVDDACARAAQAFISIDLDQAGRILAAAAVVPIAAALLVGVSLIGGEVEAGTAQTAWALAGSRARWFASQLWPVILLLGLALAFAGVATGILEDTRSGLNSSPFMDDGLQGPLLVVRGFAALTLGVLIGSLVGRTLPAFLLASIIAIAGVVGIETVRDDWANAQPQVVVDQADASTFNGLLLGQRWRNPGGEVITTEQALAIPPTQGPVNAVNWLLGSGYEPVEVGITAVVANGWQPLEIAATVVGSLALLGGSFVAVNRRRPL